MIEIKTIWIEVSLDLICDVVMKNVHPCPTQQNTSVYFVGRRVFCLSKKHRFSDRMSEILSSIEFFVWKTRSLEMSTDGHF